MLDRLLKYHKPINSLQSTAEPLDLPQPKPALCKWAVAD